jgi:hypothetical protein
MAQAIGVTSESLQQLDFAAQVSGTNVETLGTGLQKISRLAQEAATGNKTAKETLDSLGISYKNVDGTLRRADDILEDVSDKFRAMPDGAQKTAMAMDLFGKSGAALIPLLNSGSQGIKDMRSEFQELGAEMSQETAAQFEAFNDEVFKVQTASRGIRQQVVIALLPAIREIAGGMLAWIKTNKEFLQQQLAKALSVIVVAVKAFLVVAAATIEAMNFLTKHSDILLIVLGSLAAAYVILNAAAVGAALSAAAAWLVALAPLLAIAALVAAVILIVEDLYRAFTGGKSVIKDLYDAAREYLGKKITEVVSNIRAVFEKTFRGVWETVTGYIDRVVKKVKDAENAIRNLVGLAEEPQQLSLSLDNDRPSRETRRVPRVGMENPGRVDVLGSSNAMRSDSTSVTTTNNNNLTAPITVNTTGGDANEIASRTASAVRELWDVEMRKAQAGI